MFSCCSFIVSSLRFILYSLVIYAREIWWKLFGSAHRDHFTEEEIKAARLNDAVAIVTGGNCGIGLETARGLARHGLHVIIACRNQTSGQHAVESIVSSTGNQAVETMRLDLSDLSSVRHFVEDVKKRNLRVKILINNGGVMATPFQRTEEGFEWQFGVNHLGHFLLTNLLLDVLESNAPSRVVCVSSHLHRAGEVNPLHPQMDEDSYSKMGAYSNSKLCNVMFARELNERYASRGIFACSLHPGVVNSNIFRDLPWPLSPLLQRIGNLIMKNCTEGAGTSIFCALAPELDGHGGGYYADCEETWTHDLVEDEDARFDLFETSLKLVGIDSSSQDS